MCQVTCSYRVAGRDDSLVHRAAGQTACRQTGLEERESLWVDTIAGQHLSRSGKSSFTSDFQLLQAARSSSLLHLPVQCSLWLFLCASCGGMDENTPDQCFLFCGVITGHYQFCGKTLKHHRMVKQEDQGVFVSGAPAWGAGDWGSGGRSAGEWLGLRNCEQNKNTAPGTSHYSACPCACSNKCPKMRMGLDLFVLNYSPFCLFRYWNKTRKI